MLHKMQFWKDLGFNGVTEYPKIWLAKNIGHYSSLEW